MEATHEERVDSGAPGVARLAFQRPRAGGRTSIGAAYATSPLRVLTPRNHGEAAWSFLASLGGGLVDGDHLDVEVDVAAGASALLGTQATTKVYRARESSLGGHLRAHRERGCSQRLHARVGDGGLFAAIPDPVVCFEDAHYTQTIDVTLARSASLCLLDGYTCGRSARGERWAFARYASRTSIRRGGGERTEEVIDAVCLDPRHGPLADRMGRFDVVSSLVAIGPRFAPLREAMFAAASASGTTGAGDAVLVAASPLASLAESDGCILRVAAERFELASRVLRTSFAAIAAILGDDPFARKW
jgi:urease accessory protein